jgi:hypothetical protein
VGAVKRQEEVVVERRKGSDANAYWEWGSFTIRRIARIALTC